MFEIIMPQHCLRIEADNYEIDYGVNRLMITRNGKAIGFFNWSNILGIYELDGDEV